MNRSAKESHLEKIIDMKVNDLEKTVDGKLVIMEEKINNQRPEPVRVASEATGRINHLALMVAHPSSCSNSNSKQ